MLFASETGLEFVGEWVWGFAGRDSRARNHQKVAWRAKRESLDTEEPAREEDFTTIPWIGLNEKWAQREGERSEIPEKGDDQIWGEIERDITELEGIEWI